MQNIIMIDARSQCKCDAVASNGRKVNEIFIEIEVGKVTSPKLEIYTGDTLATTIKLNPSSKNAINFIPEYWNVGSYSKFRYVDDDRTGTMFTINFPSEIKNIYVRKTMDTVFTVVSKSNSGHSNVTVDVGTTTTGEPNTDAIVTNVGNDTNAIFDFIIPRGATGEKGEPGEPGEPGKGIINVTEEYYLSTSDTTQSGGSWVTTTPTWQIGTYVWTRNKISYSDGTSSYTNPICDLSINAVNEMQIGGTNILRGTNSVNKFSSYPADWNKSKWRTASGNAVIRTSIEVNDSPNAHIKLGWKFSSTTNSRGDICQDKIPVKYGQQYTLSCYARCKSGTPNLMMQSYKSSTNCVTISQPVNTSEHGNWTKFSMTFTHDFVDYPNETNIYFGMQGIGEIEICGMKLECGNKDSDWSPSPEDANVFLKNQLREFCDCSLFAQSIIDEYVNDVSIYGAQSFAIGKISGVDYMLVLFTTNNTTNNADVGILYNLSDGSIKTCTTGLTLGHCNGATFNSNDSHFYVACAGGKNGLNQIAKLTLAFDSDTSTYYLKIVETYDFKDKSVTGPYGLAYNEVKNTFYIIGSNNALVEMTADFNSIVKEGTLITKNDTFSSQSLHFDGRYISYTHNVGGTSYFDVYDTDLQFICNQFVNNFSELEGACYYNDNLYLLVNTSNTGLILKSSQYRDGKIFDFWEGIFTSNRIQVSDTVTNVYFNSTATNFFLDGSNEKPFRKLYLGWSYLLGQPLTNIRMYLTGDFSKQNINLKKYLGVLYIQGYNNTHAKIGGIYLRNCGRVHMSYLEIVKQNDTESALMSLYYGTSANVDNVKFNGLGTESTALRVIGSNCEVSNSEFNSNCTYVVYANISAFVNCSTSNKFNCSGSIQAMINSYIHLGYRTPLSTLTQSSCADKIVIGGSSYGEIDLAKITRDGKYRIEGSSTVTNCPTNLTSGLFDLTVRRNDRSTIYELVDFTNNIPYFGVLGYNATTIKWYSLTAL